MVRCVVIAVAALALVAPATAMAVPITVTRPDPPDQLTLTATSDSELVTLTGFSGSPGAWTLEFTSAATFESPAPAGCSLTSSNTVITCTDVDSSVFYVHLGGGSDTFSVTPTSDAITAAVFGGQGHDDIRGSQGDDLLFGGGDDDVIDGLGGDDEIDGWVGSSNPTAGQGTDAADILSGGPGGDDIYDTGNSAGDRINFFAESGRTGGVTVTLDFQRNDGNPGFDGPNGPGSTLGDDDIGGGIETITGTNFVDVITGNEANNLLQGAGGDDTLTGRDGHDSLVGGPGGDTLNARDSDDNTADTLIDCGSSPFTGAEAGDRADIDRADPDPINCASFTRFPTGTTTNTNTNTTTTTPTGTTPTGTTPATGILPPPRPAGTPQGVDARLGVVKTTSLRDVSRMPRVVGQRVDRARDSLRRRRINADLDVREVRAPRKGISVGTVVAQSPRAGTRLVSNAGDLVKVRLDVVEPPPAKGATCPPGSELQKLKGVDYDLADSLLDASNCKKVDVVIKKAPVVVPEVRTVKSTSGGGTQLTVAVPSTDKRNDLFMIFREAAAGVQQSFGIDWAFPTRQSALSVQVVDRAGRLVQNAEVLFDLNAVNGVPRTVKFPTGANGEIGLGNSNFGGGLAAGKAGTINVLATAKGRDGQFLYGSAQIGVVDRGQAPWQSVIGREFAGALCMVGERIPNRGSGCQTSWTGTQEVPDEGYGGRVRRGPDLPAANPTYESWIPTLQAAFSYDESAVRLLGASSSLTATNRIRTLATDGRWFRSPAQLAVQGKSPLSSAPRAPVFVKGKLWALNGGKAQEYFDNQLSASQPGVLVGAKTGQWSTTFGYGRQSSNPRQVVDAKKSDVVRFPDGTAVLNPGGDTPISAGSTGVVALYVI